MRRLLPAMTARITGWKRTKVGVAFDLADEPSQEDWDRVARLAEVVGPAHWSARPIEDPHSDEAREA